MKTKKRFYDRFELKALKRHSFLCLCFIAKPDTIIKSFVLFVEQEIDCAGKK